MALWDGRFEGAPALEMQEFGESISVDLNMWREDIAGSIAHATMLSHCGLLSAEEKKQIINGLNRVAEELEGGWRPVIEDEDIHMAVEGRLHALIGPVAGKLHTARSRNDQVATDVRLWLMKALDELSGAVERLVSSLSTCALEQGRVLVPGYTHLQRAQPIWMGHQLLAHAWAFVRDASRLRDARNRHNSCPLGAAAMAGTPHPIDREMTAELLGFAEPTPNAMDAVSARDHVQESVAACAILAGHLSRLAAELILWSSTEFQRVSLSDDWSTGSSIMPQKRNPDAAELIRGKTGRVYGNLINLLTLTKGLPMAYNRDLQEDRHALFDAFSTTMACVSVMNGCISSLTILPGPDLNGDPALATELADYLCSKNVPFRTAHHVVGQIVRHCEREGLGLDDLGLSGLQTFHQAFEPTVLEWLSPEAAVERRQSLGGAGWAQIEAQCARLQSLTSRESK